MPCAQVAAEMLEKELCEVGNYIIHLLTGCILVGVVCFHDNQVFSLLLFLSYKEKHSSVGSSTPFERHCGKINYLLCCSIKVGVLFRSGWRIAILDATSTAMRADMIHKPLQLHLTGLEIAKLERVLRF